MTTPNNAVIILTVGKVDNGKNATLAFSCALSAIAMGHSTSIFLTGDGSVWGYQGSAAGMTVQGFEPLSQLIDQYREAGGRIILCSVCRRTCSSGSPEDEPAVDMYPEIEIGGFATVLELAGDGIVVTF